MQSAFIHILLGRTPAASEASPASEAPEPNAEDGSAFASLLAGLRTLLPSGSTGEASPTPSAPTAEGNPPAPISADAPSAGAPAPMRPAEVLPIEEVPPPAGPLSTPPALPSLEETPRGQQGPPPGERPAPDILPTGGRTDVRGDAPPERPAHEPDGTEPPQTRTRPTDTFPTEEVPSPRTPSTRAPEAPEPPPAGRRQPSAPALLPSPSPTLPSSSEQTPPTAAAPLASPEKVPPADPLVEESPEPVFSRASTSPAPEGTELGETELGETELGETELGETELGGAEPGQEQSTDADSKADSGTHEEGEKAAPSEAHRSAGGRAVERETVLSRPASDSSEVAEQSTAAEAEPDTPVPEPPEAVPRQETAVPQAGNTSGPAAAQATHRPASGAAWLQALIARNVQQIGLQDGWQHLQVDLEEGQGTVTFRVRREDDRIAVRVGFSDPALRALAQNQAERLHEALQAEYGTTVDFSLSGDSGPAGEEAGQGPGGIRTTPTSLTESEPDLPQPPASLRTLIQGARHEWIG